MLNVYICPAARVSGGFSPLTLKPAVLVTAWEMVRFEFEEFVNVSVTVLLVPTCRLPKLRLVGLATKRCCGLDALHTASVQVKRSTQTERRKAKGLRELGGDIALPVSRFPRAGQKVPVGHRDTHKFASFCIPTVTKQNLLR